MGKKIQLNFEAMDDRQLLLYLVVKVNGLPERVGALEKWRDGITGGLIVVGSSAFVALAIAVWTRLGL